VRESFVCVGGGGVVLGGGMSNGMSNIFPICSRCQLCIV
jgi:hypothetical protein